MSSSWTAGEAASVERSAVASRETAAAAVVLALAAVVQWRFVVAQMHGEDEPLQATAVAQIVHALRHGSIPRVASVLTTVDNPPLRYLLSIPGWLVAPGTEWGLRLGAALLSLAMVSAVIRLGRELGGPVVGIAAGALVAVSPVYAWTSSAFGWSVIVVSMLMAIRHLRFGSLDLEDPRGRRHAVSAQAWIALAFLSNSGVILLAVGAGLVYVRANLRRPALLVRAFGWPAAFYAAYYVLFAYALPWVASRYYHTAIVSGQLGHGNSRLRDVGLGYAQFLESLRVLNGYFLPFVAWALVALGVAELVRHERRILVFLAPFTFAWSFVLRTMTSQYVLLVAIVLVPLAVNALARVATPRRAGFVVGSLAAALLAWTTVFFVVPYTSDAMPNVFRYLYAANDRGTNVVEPYAAIRRLVDARVAPGQQYLEDGAGSLPTFYLKQVRTEPVDPRFAGALGDAAHPVVETARGCYRLAFTPPRALRLAITTLQLCEPTVAHYPGSQLVVYSLR